MKLPKAVLQTTSNDFVFAKWANHTIWFCVIAAALAIALSWVHAAILDDRREDSASQTQCHKLGGVWISNHSKTLCEYPPSAKCTAEKEERK